MIISPLIAGTIASVLHVISGPDHLAAVTPLVVETKKKKWKIGLFWGFGHLMGMLFIGVLFLLFKDVIPIEAISAYSEQLVAFVLIGVGLWALFRIFNKKNGLLLLRREHNADTHVHLYKREVGEEEQVSDKTVRQNYFSSLGIGLLHGLAGVAHFILLLPVLGFESNFEGGQYIIGFAIGTVLAMSVYALILGKIVTHTKHQYNEHFFTGVRFLGGGFAVVVGIYWLYLSF
ncbi:hypothetical protein DN752_01660 [Echinicola strongylocentroti]|uniref:Urease accessory protein UreH-like transmembrane domain-containing protein n=1 Tax=Echinicola strongylocentroti TaxID=1795355 RepID=A0A2Z4IDN5_9BACT|nr:sulfite exporter TauE/SafE family protein [Echinicola strongylocentroti]AWW28940.1 hypothetical protein DN752_01660 [Echinicola strongylocentroti]